MRPTTLIILVKSWLASTSFEKIAKLQRRTLARLSSILHTLGRRGAVINLGELW